MTVEELILFLTQARWVGGRKELGPVMGPERAKATNLIAMLTRYSPGTPVRFEKGLTPQDLLEKNADREWSERRGKVVQGGIEYYFIDPRPVTATAEMVDGVVVVSP